MSGWANECPACKGYLDQAHAPDCTYEPEDFLDTVLEAVLGMDFIIDGVPDLDPDVEPQGHD